jgi:hypothetical protein
LLVLVSSLYLTQLTESQKPWRVFVIQVPGEVSGSPGETVTINAGILNKGMWWLHNFNLSLSGLPAGYEYTFNPQHWDDLPILRAWDPVNGLYIVPSNFTLTIKIPENAVGSQLVTITGQEFMSWKQFSNSTQFILKALSIPSFELTDIVIPETVKEGQPFNITMRAKNSGSTSGKIDVTVKMPADWNVTEKTKSLIINASSSSPVVFTITPTNTSGQVTIYAEYPYKATVVNITKVGPVLMPVREEVPSGVTLPTFGRVTDVLRGVSPVVIGVIVVLVIIILWNVWSIYRDYKTRKKPEEMKK